MPIEDCAGQSSIPQMESHDRVTRTKRSDHILNVPAIEPLRRLASGEPQRPVVVGELGLSWGRRLSSGDGGITLGSRNNLGHFQGLATQKRRPRGSNTARHLAAQPQNTNADTLKQLFSKTSSQRHSQNKLQHFLLKRRANFTPFFSSQKNYSRVALERNSTPNSPTPQHEIRRLQILNLQLHLLFRNIQPDKTCIQAR